MRIRTIKPEFWESESLGRVSRDARLLFVGLFNSCDDSGRTRGSSRVLASRIFPYDNDALGLIDGWLAELEKEKCIRVYSVDGSTFLDIPKWHEHQKIDRPSKSKFPEFVEASRVFGEASRKIALEQGTGNREQGKEQGAGSEPAAVAAPASLSDEEWLAALAADPTYAGVDVIREHGKMMTWCSVNKKQPTRRRFANWINRAEKPMNGQAPKSQFDDHF